MTKRILKTIFITGCIFAATAGVTAHAQIGDIAGKIYTTDILTQIDGRDIPSYAIDGETMIALEDLEQYGFNVKYDDSVRTVFINQTGECPADFSPTVKRGKPGAVAGYYYESDITAYVNGCRIDAYALDGKMAAKVEALGRVAAESQYGVSAYLMTYEYDDGKRLLSLYTGKDKLPSADEIRQSYKTNDDERDIWWFYGGEERIDGGYIIKDGQSGTTHGTYLYYHYVGDDKLTININTILGGPYKFHDGWGHLEIYNVEIDGSCMVFEGTTWDGNSGKYKFDPRICELTAIDEQYDSERDYEAHMLNPSIDGWNVYTASVKAEIDGIPVETYYIENTNRALIDAGIFDHLGYNIYGDEDCRIYIKAGDGDRDWHETPKEAGICIGQLEVSAGYMYINGAGSSLELFRVGDKILIDLDWLWRGREAYLIYRDIDSSPNGIYGGYDSGAGAVILKTSDNSKFAAAKAAMLDLPNQQESGIKVEPEIMGDNEEYFAVKYPDPYNDKSKIIFLAKSNGEVYDINTLIYNLSNFEAYEIKDAEIKDDILTVHYGENEVWRLDILTMEIL